MRYPDLDELPSPPTGRRGWPWTEATPPLGESGASHSAPWPKISIVTPSLNQARFLEETIRSVLLQSYPDLQYIIIDGGSTDGSVEIINKYSCWLHYWVSEPDHGQSHAINKGFANATGTLLAYINSDDLYEPGAFKRMASAFEKTPSPDLSAGICTVFDEHGEKRIFEPQWPQHLSDYVKKTFSSTFGQPAAFWTRDIYLKAGGFDESLHFSFDREFFLKAGLNGCKTRMLSQRIARFREHSQSKSLSQVVAFHEESIQILKKYGSRCGLSNSAIRHYERAMLHEIGYMETFRIWKAKGRMAALRKFLQMLETSPNLLLQRKFLGQIRRLLFFREKNVEELRSTR